MRRSMLFFLSLFFISIGCQNDPAFIGSDPEPEPEVVSDLIDIPSPLHVHFENFRSAALDRGFLVDFSRAGITAEMRELNQGSVAGVCSTNGIGLRHITIDTDFWNRASFLSREMIVFHELGHCLLRRGHTEDTFQNGLCVSIMRSGTGGCRDAYSNRNRQYYLNELFGVDDEVL